MKALALRPTTPDIGAVARSLLGVLLVAGFGMYWVGAVGAMFAAGAAAIAGATALHDSPRGRVSLVVGVSVVMGVAVLLGASTSAYSILFAVVVGLWCFWAGMAWAAGTNPGLIAAAAAALLVIAPAVEPSWTAVVGSAALAVAGGLVQAALIAIWPRRPWREQREALARAYESLAADAGRLAHDPAGHVTREPLVRLRDAFTLTAGRAGRRPLAYRAWYGLPERIAVTLSAISGRATGDDACSRVLFAAADVLAAVAVPNRANARLADAAMDRYDAAAPSVSGSESTLVERLSDQLREATALRFGGSSPRLTDLHQLRRPAWPGAIAPIVAAVRGHLTPASPVLRHAVRLAVAAACGIAVARFAEVSHGYWIPLTVVMVLRPETAHTYTRCVGRVAGTLVGVVAASTITLAFHPSGFTAATLAVVFLGIAYAVTGFGYLAVAAAISASIVLLVEIGGVAGLATVGDRVLATLIGGVLAVLAHVALPDQAGVRLRQRASELLKTEIDYAATVIRASVHDLDRPGEQVAAAWERALRARAAFEATAGGAGVADDRALRRWLRFYRTGLNAVTTACAALEANLPARHVSEASRDLVSAVDEYVEALCGDPQIAGSPWTVDVAVLTAAIDRLQARSSDADDASVRILVAEIVSMTDHLVAISAGMQAPD